MRKLFLIITLALAGSPALGADMPVKAPVAPAPVYTTGGGFYLGVNVGGAKMSSDFDTTLGKELLIPGTGNIHPSGLLAGLTAGGGFWNGAFYLGIEGDADYDFSKQNTPNCGLAAVADSAVVTNCRVKSGMFFTERAVLGVTLGSITGAAVRQGATAPSNWPVPISAPVSAYAANMMLFVTGGSAQRELKACIEPVGCNSQWLVGWTLGGGLKLPISAHVDLTAKYLYIDWNKHFNPAGPAVFDPANFKAGSEQLGMLNLNYHF